MDPLRLTAMSKPQENVRLALQILESLSQSSDSVKLKQEAEIQNIINGINQIKRELATDLGNIRAPVVSRAKKVLIEDTMRELDVLTSNLNSLFDKPINLSEVKSSEDALGAMKR